MADLVPLDRQFVRWDGEAAIGQGMICLWMSTEPD